MKRNSIYKKIFLFFIGFVVLFTGCNAISSKKDLLPVTAANKQLVIEDQFVYLPLLLNNYPPTNIMGAQLSQINDQKGLALMLAANSKWTRQDYLWEQVEPTEGTIQWSNAAAIDQQLVNAANSQMEVLLILGATPEWARYPGWGCGGRINPDKYSDFSIFMYEFVKRYSNPPYNVTYFEMWNEPDAANLLGCWGDPSDNDYYGGYAYGEMLILAYQAAKSANPNVEILVGGLLLDCDPDLGLKNPDGTLKDCRPAHFLKGILEAGAGNSFDGVAFHAYDYYQGELGKYNNGNFAASWNTTGPVTLEKSKYLRDVLQTYGFQQKYLLNTEAALLCATCDPANATFQTTKAYYVAQEFSTAIVDGYAANLWYSVYGDRNSGLLSPDNTPYPAYYAFGFTSKALQNHDFVKKLTNYPNVMGFEFVSKSGKRQWVLWSIDSQVHTITLSTTPSSIHKIDTTGNGVPLSISTSVPIGIAPVFIKY